MRYRFGTCELDGDAVELRVDGDRVAVEPQVFDVLVHLLEHRDRVVRKEELLDEVWGHRFVTESALTSRIKSARRAIGDDGTRQHLIRTVHGKGYQFVGDVSVVDDRIDDAPPRRLPRPPTPTIGRDHDVEVVLAALERSRLVTLVGPGGVGKTRLAIEAAWRRPPSGPVTFVDLTKTRAPDVVPDLVAAELGVRSTAGDPVASLAAALHGRGAVVVLDNLEHVIAAAPFVGDLLARVDDLRVLATSRERLRVGGEQVVDVIPLPVDDAPGGDAVSLFVQSALAADPRFDIDACRDDVVAICRAVDGLPLAVELAAGHLRALPPVLLRARLGALLSHGSGARDAPARQQTMSATIDWSLRLLSVAEEALFRRLGVFAGPVPLAWIEAVCAGSPVDDVVATLTRLVEQSLVRRDDGMSEPRFGMLELLHERAAELLGSDAGSEEIERRHAAVVIERLSAIEEQRWTVLAGTWIDLVDQILPEIRLAHTRAIERADHGVAATIVARLGTFWHREGHHVEGRAWARQALEHLDRLDARTAAGVHLSAGLLAWGGDDPGGARAHWLAAIDEFRALGDDRLLAYALALLGGTYVGDRDHYDQALTIVHEGLALAHRVGEHPLVADVLNVKGELARVAGDDELAGDAYREGLAHAAACGDLAHESVFVANLAFLASHAGDFAEGRRLGREGLRRCWSLGRTMMAAWSLGELAGPVFGLGEPETAARLIGASDHTLAVLGVGRHPADRPEVERTREALHDVLGADRLATLAAEGARLPLAAAVALALGEAPS